MSETLGGKFFCFHKYEFQGVDYTETPYMYILRCKKCDKIKATHKYPKGMRKAKYFSVIDNPLTALMRRNGDLPTYKRG